jgi:hypothetical protein
LQAGARTSPRKKRIRQAFFIFASFKVSNMRTMTYYPRFPGKNKDARGDGRAGKKVPGSPGGAGTGEAVAPPGQPPIPGGPSGAPPRTQ